MDPVSRAVPGTFNTSFPLIYIFLTANWHGVHYHPHFAEKETEVREVISLGQSCIAIKWQTIALNLDRTWSIKTSRQMCKMWACYRNYGVHSNNTSVINNKSTMN